METGYFYTLFGENRGLGKQSKTLNKSQIQMVSNHLRNGRNGLRNQTIFLLSVKIDLRAKEISQLSWKDVCNSDGEVDTQIRLPRVTVVELFRFTKVFVKTLLSCLIDIRNIVHLISILLLLSELKDHLSQHFKPSLICSRSGVKLKI